MNYEQELISFLTRSAEKVRDARLPAEIADTMERLAKQVNEPCVLAVVGRAKAGKSSLINAFLREDLAKVGVTETTATINFFRYGNPSDQARPIRCHWQGGQYEDVSRDFLDSLQGNDPETLRRAAGIEYLEYLLPNPILRDITLVDTPGTEAAVDEHQNRTADLLKLHQQLRDRHNQETERWASEADAVIYLIGQVPRATDQALLQEFAHVTGGRSRALNAVGVMAKIDLYPEEIRPRIAKIAQQLKESLNTIVPVSAGIQRALDRWQQDHNDGLHRFMTKLRQIPARRLAKLLDSDELYEEEFDDCPVSVEERRELRRDMPWSVFTTIARLAADPHLSEAEVVRRLEELAGFGPLREVLERHFFKRSRLLRCYRILNDTRKLLDDIRFKYYPKFLQRDRDDAAMRERFLTFIRSAPGSPEVARELEDFVTRVLAPQRAARLELLRQELDRNLSRLLHEMEDHNADFGALEQIEKHQDRFTPNELEELRRVLGLYGVETEKRVTSDMTIEQLAQRQQFWADVWLRSRDTVRRDVAKRAEVRYSLILKERLPEN